jgi:hypothetical protein
VAEEGVDIQPCNLVIHFDPLLTTKSYIQSRGRARHKNATLVCIVADSDRKTMEIVSKVAHMESLVKEAVLNNKKDSSPLQTIHDDQWIFRVESTGAVLSASSSVQLLAMYCQSCVSLESDGVATYEVEEKSSGMYFCTVLLPPGSGLDHPVVGSDAHTPKLAKWYAAFAACKQLYEKKFLDEYLRPIKLASFSDTDTSDVSRSKSKSSLRSGHKVPDVIATSWKNSGDVFHVHILHFDGLPHSMYQKSPISIGFLATKITTPHVIKYACENPKNGMCNNFQFYDTKTTVTLDACQIDMLKYFHSLIFSFVQTFNTVHLDESGKIKVASDFDKSEKFYLLAPLDEAGNIDWETVKGVNRPIKDFAPVTKDTDLKTSVVVSWYNDVRLWQPTCVRTDLTLKDTFYQSTMAKDVSYIEYYKERYDITLTQHDDHVVEVKFPKNVKSRFYNQQEECWWYR